MPAAGLWERALRLLLLYTHRLHSSSFLGLPYRISEFNQALDGAFIYYTSPTSQPRSIEVFVAVEEVPVKRTFVHFDVPRQDCDRAMKFSILLGLGFRVEYIPQIDPVLQVHRHLPL